MLVAAIHENGLLVPSQHAIPALPEGGALLRVSGCGICGSDLDKVLLQKAAAGTVLGHEVVGKLDTLSRTVAIQWPVGTRLVVSHHVPCGHCRYCLADSESMCPEFKRSNLQPGGFAEVIGLSAGHLQHTAFAIPDAISDEEASCLEPLACVLRAYRRSRGIAVSKDSSAGKTTLIVGLGFIGLLAAQTYAFAGETVFGADIDPSRLDWALSQGALYQGFLPEYKSDSQPLALSEPVDTVFLSVVNAATLSLALATVRDGGQIVLFTSPGQAVQLPMLDPNTLYFREISVLSSYSPALQDLRQAANLIFNNQLYMKDLISESVPLTSITEALERYRRGETRKVYIQITPPSSQDNKTTLFLTQDGLPA
jgi:L-iditol 2-dehydrogenase